MHICVAEGNVETDLPCARRAKRFRRPLTRRNNAEQSKHVTRPVRQHTGVSSFTFRWVARHGGLPGLLAEG